MIRFSGCPYPGKLEVPRDLVLCDVTLREGEQTPGAAFTLDEKLELAARLDEIGVGQIQLPMPRLDARLIDITKRICMLGLKAKTEVMTVGKLDTWREQIDVAAGVGADIIHSSFGIGSFNAPVWTDAARQAMLERIATVTSYMKTTGMPVNVSFTDATRADLAFALACAKTAAESGADRIRFADSFGITGPESWYTLISCAAAELKPYGVRIAAHCHNDLGLALADALACIRGGASTIDVSVNGIGDRAGNVCLEQIAVALEVLYGQASGLDVSRLTELSRFVSSISGVPVPSNKPLVGANVFAEEAGGHAVEQFSCPVEGRALVPEDIGGKLGVVYGKMTNERVIELTAQRAGREIPRSAYPAILNALSDATEANKGHCLYEEDFWRIVDAL